MKSLNYITPMGLKKIEEELHQLLYKERPTIVKTVTWAAENGDRSENADYIYGKKRLREIDRRIRFLEGRLDNIEVIDPSKIEKDHVSFGATVTVVDEDDQELCYQIVGEDEFSIEHGKISWKSPVARALMNKCLGDTVTIKRPKGNVEVEVIKIEYI